MADQTCAVCGQDGYWVAFDSRAGENRCVNHISVQQAFDPETLQTLKPLDQELELLIAMPTEHTDGGL